MRISGWSLTASLALALIAMSALVMAMAGVDESGVRTLIRVTARSSAALFLLAFVARPLRQAWRSALSRWLLANRRYLGVAAAVSHLIHLSAIVWLRSAWPRSYEVAAQTAIFGGLGFAFFFAMALTSSDRAVARMGKNWRRLHKTGVWYLWFIFIFTFVPDADRGWDGLHVFFVAAFAAAAGLRAIVFAPRRRG
jgi:DMSO/TMAO reductase YedYZ heme-binding membrane subunit